MVGVSVVGLVGEWVDDPPGGVGGVGERVGEREGEALGWDRDGECEGERLGEREGFLVEGCNGT